MTELADALRGRDPEAEVVTCLEVPDGEGDYLLFSECLLTSRFSRSIPLLVRISLQCFIGKRA